MKDRKTIDVKTKNGVKICRYDKRRLRNITHDDAHTIAVYAMAKIAGVTPNVVSVKQFNIVKTVNSKVTVAITIEPIKNVKKERKHEFTFELPYDLFSTADYELTNCSYECDLPDNTKEPEEPESFRLALIAMTIISIIALAMAIIFGRVDNDKKTKQPIDNKPVVNTVHRNK